MKYIDEYNNVIENPDWSIFTGVRTMEVSLDNGEFEVVMICRKLSAEEIIEAELIDRVSRMEEQIKVLNQILLLKADLSDEDALKVEALYPDWEIGLSYVTGDIRRYKGLLYRSLQDSIATSVHTPDIAVSLWKKIGEPDQDTGIFTWIQPLGATDAYMIGDKVKHNDMTWISTVDNNVWEPGVYGWEEISGGDTNG